MLRITNPEPSLVVIKMKSLPKGTEMYWKALPPVNSNDHRGLRPGMGRKLMSCVRKKKNQTKPNSKTSFIKFGIRHQGGGEAPFFVLHDSKKFHNFFLNIETGLLHCQNNN